MPKLKKARKRKMSDPTATDAAILADVIKEKVDLKNDVRLEISGPGDGQTLHLFIRAPILAEVVRKMATGNYPKAGYTDVYQPLLVTLMDKEGAPVKDRVVTRPAIAKATKNIVGGTDFDWEQPPRAILLANPDKLAEGYTLIIKQEKPVPPDILRRWGKQLMDGCADIIQNARPFKMSWVMQEIPKVG